MIPSQADQVERVSFLAAQTDLHRRLMDKGQCDISRFPMGIFCSGLVLKFLGVEEDSKCVYGSFVWSMYCTV